MDWTWNVQILSPTQQRTCVKTPRLCRLIPHVNNRDTGLNLQNFCRVSQMEVSSYTYEYKTRDGMMMDWRRTDRQTNRIGMTRTALCIQRRAVKVIIVDDSVLLALTHTLTIPRLRPESRIIIVIIIIIIITVPWGPGIQKRWWLAIIIIIIIIMLLLLLSWYLNDRY